MASLNTTNLELQLEQVIALLREANDEYKWDPATFAVTVVIGAIATLLTVLAIGQGLLAAGPGRLKSGHFAVGPWSKTQKTRFAWGEWRFRTTVETPIIRLHRREKGWFPMDQDIDNLRAPDMLWHLHVVVNVQRQRRKSKHYSEYFPAAWLKLLTVLHLDRPGLWRAERLGADYIPSDLPAAQAYGSIRDVSILTLMAADGAAVVRQDSVNGLPFVQGTSQTSVTLSFREHPLLGIAGSLSTFDTREFWARDNMSHLFPGRAIIKLQDLSKSLDYAFGRVDMSGPAGTARLFGAPSPGDIGFPGQGCICHDGLGRMAASRQGRTNTSLPRRDNEAALHRMLALAMARPPNVSPPAFPSTGANLLDMLALFATQSTTWKTGISRTYLRSAPSVDLSALLNHGPSQWLDSRQADQATAESKLLLYESVLEGCFDLMNDLMPHGTAEGMTPGHYFQHIEAQDDPDRLDPDRLPTGEGYIRVRFQIVKRSIHEIDKWVESRQDSLSEWLRTAYVMSEIASRIDALKQEMARIRGKQSVAAAEEWESAKRRVLEDPLLKTHLHAEDISMGLETLLGSWDFGEALPRPVDLPGCLLADLMVYRIALIVVALSGWSADSTILLDEKYDRIVPIL